MSCFQKLSDIDAVFSHDLHEILRFGSISLYVKVSALY